MRAEYKRAYIFPVAPAVSQVAFKPAIPVDLPNRLPFLFLFGREYNDSGGKIIAVFSFFRVQQVVQITHPG